MEQLLELARRLGRQIAAHERTTELKSAQGVVDEDSEAANLVKAYQQHIQKIADLEKQKKPIEVADKHMLKELEEKIGVHPSLRELTRRQVDFIEMMRKVKEAIDGELEIDPS